MMPQLSQAHVFTRLANHDEALRASLLILVNDPAYQMLPMRQVTTFYRSIYSDNYLLMLQSNRAIGVIMWMEISAEVMNACLTADRSPLVGELKGRSDALYCTALSAVQPGAVLPLWRHFAHTHADRDILVKRHFQGGKPQPRPVALVRNERRVRLEAGRGLARSSTEREQQVCRAASSPCGCR